MASLFRKLISKGTEAVESSTEFFANQFGSWEETPKNESMFENNETGGSSVINDTASVTSELRRSYRAPDPTQGKTGWGSRRGVETVNLRHRAAVSGEKGKLRNRTSNPMLESASMSSMTEMQRVSLKKQTSLKSEGKIKEQKTMKKSMKNFIGNTLGRKKNRSLLLSSNSENESGKPVTSETETTDIKVAPENLHGTPKQPSVSIGLMDPNLSAKMMAKSGKKRTQIGSTNSKGGSRKVSDTSEGTSLSAALQKTKEKTATLPRRVQEMKKKYLSTLYARGEKTKDKKGVMPAENKADKYKKGSTDHLEFRGLGSDDFEFKKAMVEKYHSLSGSFGSYGNNMLSGIPLKARKSSSFSMENPMVLLLGSAKSGKSTIFKQLLSLAGHPPNYARAYIPTKSPVEREVQIDETQLQVVDVGGAKQDVVNWRFYLSAADLIVYVVSLDEYDRVVKKKDGGETGSEQKRSQLLESLELFDSIINNVALLNSKFVLVFNKLDRFKKKYCDKKVSLVDVGVYENPPTGNDLNEALDYFQNMFLEKAATTDHDVKVEIISATDAEACGEMLQKVTGGLARSQEVTRWKNLL